MHPHRNEFHDAELVVRHQGLEQNHYSNDPRYPDRGPAQTGKAEQVWSGEQEQPAHVIKNAMKEPWNDLHIVILL